MSESNQKKILIATKTNSDDTNFQVLVRALDEELEIRDGNDHLFYSQFNKTDKIKHAIVIYDQDEPIGCGAIREYAPGIMEIKRMYVLPHRRKQGIASMILTELETWSAALNYHTCILETGKNQPEAIQLYVKNQYRIIPNYAPYELMVNSICFEKILPTADSTF
jgi:GNAT superfamily N-acetyltransferase